LCPAAYPEHAAARTLLVMHLRRSLLGESACFFASACAADGERVTDWWSLHASRQACRGRAAGLGWPTCRAGDDADGRGDGHQRSSPCWRRYVIAAVDVVVVVASAARRVHHSISSVNDITPRACERLIHATAVRHATDSETTVN